MTGLAKRSIQGITPPVVWNVARAVYRRLTTPMPDQTLFDGAGSEAFQRLARNCRVYGEYGVGKSTIWIAANTDADILAVDSSQHWIDQTAAELPTGRRHRIVHVDLGALGQWGRPLTYARRDNFRTYVESLWQQDISPDLVLIDGRFRVSCLMHSLLSSRLGTALVFDDYVGRGQYHVVEELLKPHELSGRQAIFVNDGGFCRDAAARLRDEFMIVID